MKEDGTMMRTPELAALAAKWDMKFITIKDLQNYRKCHEKLVEQVAVVNMPTKYGDFKACGFVNKLNGEHHVALVKGDIGDGKVRALPRAFGVSYRRYLRFAAL